MWQDDWETWRKNPNLTLKSPLVIESESIVLSCYHSFLPCSYSTHWILKGGQLEANLNPVPAVQEYQWCWALQMWCAARLWHLPWRTDARLAAQSKKKVNPTPMTQPCHHSTCCILGEGHGGLLQIREICRSRTPLSQWITLNMCQVLCCCRSMEGRWNRVKTGQRYWCTFCHLFPSCSAPSYPRYIAVPLCSHLTP